MVSAAYYGMSYSDYIAMDAEEFSSWLKGRGDREESELKLLRWQVAALLNVHSKKPIKPTDLLTLPSDKKTIKKIDRERVKKVFAKWDKKL